MKAVIFAGGLGTRISEETSIRPKPMVEIGQRPILWHIMKIYSYYGINDFIICCGYKGEVIKEYFVNYRMKSSTVSIDLNTNDVQISTDNMEPWRIVMAETGANTMTGGRLKQVRDFIGDETFCLTYGDGVADINVKALVDLHKQQNKLCTMTAVQPPGRWGAFSLGDDDVEVKHFREKPEGDGAWINGGFFVCEPKVIDYIEGDQTVWEREPMSNIAHDGEMVAYKHAGFWQPMDTLRDKNLLESLWESGKAPWKVW
ncbi:MAG: glucose-1-phosphate cytidylyltransferase [Phycisphaeraceae bacterium]